MTVIPTLKLCLFDLVWLIYVFFVSRFQDPMVTILPYLTVSFTSSILTPFWYSLLIKIQADLSLWYHRCHSMLLTLCCSWTSIISTDDIIPLALIRIHTHTFWLYNFMLTWFHFINFFPRLLLYSLPVVSLYHELIFNTKLHRKKYTGSRKSAS